MVTEQASNGTRVKSAVTRLPGLDGVRALAVIAVIAFHEQLSVLPGGFLGVDVFFVLSGYLITDLLVAQWHQHGRLRLGNFWARRARRLLPALATMLVGGHGGHRHHRAQPAGRAAARPAGRGHLLQQLVAGAAPPVVLHPVRAATAAEHLWSLAIEEQFYLVWPTAAHRAAERYRSSRILAGAAWLCAAQSALATVLIYRPARIRPGLLRHRHALVRALTARHCHSAGRCSR